MDKEKISGSQGVNLVILFIFGSTLIIGTGGQAKNDMWIAILVAILFSVLILLMYSRILYRYPGKDLYDILEEVFGKFIGRIFSFIFIWFFLHLGALVLRNFGEFINTTSLPETPMIVPMSIFAFVCILGVKSGIETLAKCSGYFMIIISIFLIIITLLALPKVNPENILPIMSNGIKPILLGALSAFSFPLGELVVFMMVFDSLSKPSSIYKVYLRALIIGGLVVALLAMRNIMILGAETIATLYFPSYSAVSRINIGNFLQRLEVSVTIVFLLTGFTKISICLLAATKGLSKLFGYKDYRFFVTPIGLLMVNLAYLIYGNIIEMLDWAREIWPYYAIPFEVILPLIVFIGVEVKAKLQKKDNQAKNEAQV